MQKVNIPSARSAFSVTERDPSTHELVEIQMYQDEKTGRYFGIDNSFIIDEDPQLVNCPFGHKVELVDDFED
jgi:hypothetical protein